MGCGSSKSTATDTDTVDSTNHRFGKHGQFREKEANGTRKLKNGLRNKENSLQANDLPGVVPESETDSRPPPVTFEIPANENASIIKKHPPKRLQKLEDQQISMTHERLVEKQMSAKERRQKLLQERVQSSRRSASRAGRQMMASKGPNAILEQMEQEKVTGESPNHASDIQEF